VFWAYFKDLKSKYSKKDEKKKKKKKKTDHIVNKDKAT
jgi:hypothetical protein